MATAKKQQLHLRVSPEDHAFLKGIAMRRGESLSEALEFLLGRLRAADDAYFLRHAALQSYVARRMIVGFSEGLEALIDTSEDSEAVVANRARAKVASRLQAVMKDATQLFGPELTLPEKYRDEVLPDEGAAAALASQKVEA